MNSQKDSLLIMPAYNEENNIGATLDDIKKAKLIFDCLIIDDGSSDSTSDLAKKHGCIVLRHPFNMGYGSALYTGFKYAHRKGYKQVVIMDADGQHKPKCIANLVQRQEETNADVVIGSRFLATQNYKFSHMKNLARLFLILLIYLFSGKKFSDPTSGFQLLRRRAFEFLAKIDFPEDYPDADIIILIILNGFKVEEVAVEMEYRRYGASIHSGLKPLYYGYKIIISVLSIFINSKLVSRQRKAKK